MRKRGAVVAIVSLAAIVTVGGTTAAMAADHDDHEQAAKSVRVDLDTAKQAATTRVPGAAVTEAELDHDQGRSVWEFDLAKQTGQKYEVTVDASTGKVISARPDDARTDGHDNGSDRGHHSDRDGHSGHDQHDDEGD